jgi:glycosyltransferase involved in cell wall biosynthesis
MTGAREATAALLAPDVLPAFQVEWLDGAAVWEMAPSYEPWAEHGTEPTLLGAEPISWRFPAPASALTSVSVTLAAWGRLNTTPVWAELIDEDGVVLRRQFTEAQAVADGTPTRVLSLDGLLLELGRRYTVSLTAPTAKSGNGFACYRASSEPGRYIYAKRIKRFCDRRLFLPGPTIRKSPVLFLCGLSDDEAAEAVIRFPGLPADRQVRVERFTTVESAWALAREADAVGFAGCERLAADIFDPLVFALFRLGVCTVSVEIGGALQTAAQSAGALLSPGLTNISRAAAASMGRCVYHLDRGGGLSSRLAPDLALNTLADARADLDRRRDPKVVIASVLYRKKGIIGRFLGHIEGQSYPGDIVVSLIDDGSPEADAAEAARAGERWTADEALRRSLVISANERNLGNCISRDRAIAGADGDLYIVVDCDCLLNRDFVAAHVFEHAAGDADVVIGPINIESWNNDPEAVLATLENDPAKVIALSEPQDPIQADGFLNCITRNFSVTAEEARREPLFDPAFSYSAAPGGGFGWEDVEMGYRLYRRGARIRATPLAFCVHATHPSTIGLPAQIAGSMRNFERLFAKHPELATVVRRWALDTYGRLSDWADAQGVDGGDARRALDARFFEGRRSFAPLLNGLRGKPSARLRILSYRWHAPHQYEIYKLPHDFTLATSLGNGMIETWPYEQRPLRDNVQFRRIDRIDPRDYDLMILHFDENILAPELCNGVIPAHWGDPFNSLSAFDLPRIAVCHGTPAFLGQYGASAAPIDPFVTYEDERRRLVSLLEASGAHVVCNSWQALAEWGFARSRVIWHGFDPQEFPMGRHDQLLLAPETDLARPHYRGAWVQTAILEALGPSARPGSAYDRAPPPIEIRASNAFAARNLRLYVEQIGRHQIYLNTTLRSPMPRARGEAMMTGVAPVCLRNHDVDRFIDQGVDGFHADEPGALIDFIQFVENRPDIAAALCEAARSKACDVFNHDRFLNQWSRLLSDVAG